VFLRIFLIEIIKNNILLKTVDKVKSGSNIPSMKAHPYFFVYPNHLGNVPF